MTSNPSVNVPDSVTYLGGYVFQNCASLTHAVVGSGVTACQYRLFADCIHLTDIAIGGSVTDLGDEAFSGCFDLTSVYFRGDAPTYGNATFDAGIGSWLEPKSSTTLYVLPAKSGWSSSFDNLPVVTFATWDARVRTGDSSFGMQGNQFGFTIEGTDGLVVLVEASTDMTNWSTVATVTLTGGTYVYTDPDTQNHSTRFYRLRSP